MEHTTSEFILKFMNNFLQIRVRVKKVDSIR